MSAFSVKRLLGRELGMGRRLGDGDRLAKSLYCSMKPVAEWDPFQMSDSQFGGVFNLEFSPGGSLLVAACEKKSVLIFDPLTHERIHTVSEAHGDCVNCVKFLDGRMFATCSDDTTIALWDVRNLNKRIRTLSGHSNWVKNIEYSVKDKLLVTSGLDGSIYTWDINSYTEWSLVYQRVFHASGLMRCRISPDASQMVMCTTGGLLIIVHDLNLGTLARDLHGFKPNLYRLMQMSQQVIPIAACYDQLFDHKRHENRIEFVSDFPDGNDAEVVSSLQIHPQGWSALSRNISHMDKSEWTCIHDIQSDISSSGKSVVDTTPAEDPPPPPRPALYRINRTSSRHERKTRSSSSRSSETSSTSAAGPSGNSSSGSGAGGSGSGASGSGSGASASGSGASGSGSRASGSSANWSQDGASSSGSSGGAPAQDPRRGVLHGIQNDVWEANITIKEHRQLQEMTRRGQVGRNFNVQRIIGINTGISPPPPSSEPPPPSSEPPPRRRRTARRASTPSSDRSRPCNTVRVRYLDPDPEDPDDVDEHRPIRQNKKRLLYYTQETNEGKGFIKELCYSSDGRLVCSPFGYGIRLLATDERCAELSHCVAEGASPRGLVEVGQSAGRHPDLVVSSKFSPVHPLLVTGCLAGKVVWYQPVG